MLTEFSIEALLVDEGLADQVWEAWHEGRNRRSSGLVGLVAYSWRPLRPRKRPLSW